MTVIFGVVYGFLSRVCVCIYCRGFPGALVVKNLPANAEDVTDVVQSLGQEDPLEEGLATIPVFLPGESHGQRSLAGHSP